MTASGTSNASCWWSSAPRSQDSLEHRQDVSDQAGLILGEYHDTVDVIHRTSSSRQGVETPYRPTASTPDVGGASRRLAARVGTVAAVAADLGYDHVLERLTGIVGRCAAAGDRVGYFAAMYLAVTDTVRARAEAGGFQDAARMERFVGGFDDRYLRAHDAWRAGSGCPVSWRAAFEATRRWRPVILQHLLLGMNAHINLDLGVTASTLGEGGSLAAVREDFDAINDVLAELVEGCQQALDEVSPWLDFADRIGGAGDETMIRFSLVMARDQAWSTATRLAALSGPRRDAEIAAVDRATAGVAHLVEHPGVPASALLMFVRARERAAPRDVMALLAAVRPAPR
jgi:Family of unknown function (DUF5995)